MQNYFHMINPSIYMHDQQWRSSNLLGPLLDLVPIIVIFPPIEMVIMKNAIENILTRHLIIKSFNSILSILNFIMDMRIYGYGYSLLDINHMNNVPFFPMSRLLLFWTMNRSRCISKWIFSLTMVFAMGVYVLSADRCLCLYLFVCYWSVRGVSM